MAGFVDKELLDDLAAGLMAVEHHLRYMSDLSYRDHMADAIAAAHKIVDDLYDAVDE